MTIENPQDIIDPIKFAQALWDRAQPIDFDELQRTGQITKVGAWWLPNAANPLPEYVWKQANPIKHSEQGMLLKFPASLKRAQRLAERLGIDWKGPRPT